MLHLFQIVVALVFALEWSISLSLVTTAVVLVFTLSTNLIWQDPKRYRLDFTAWIILLRVNPTSITFCGSVRIYSDTSVLSYGYVQLIAKYISRAGTGKQRPKFYELCRSRISLVFTIEVKQKITILSR